MKESAPVQPAASPPAVYPPAASPPALAYATAPAPRPVRLLGAALVLHLAVLGCLVALLHTRRMPPATAPQSIALVIQKAPPAPPNARPKPAAPPAQAAAIPRPPPPPPQPPRREATKPPPTRNPATTLRVTNRPAPTRTAGRPSPLRPTVPARALPGNPPPMVPAFSHQPGKQGWVRLSVQIGPDGSPQAATIAESSGYQFLDQRVRSSVLQHWRFQPATLAGQPIASTIELWVSFGLSN